MKSVREEMDPSSERATREDHYYLIESNSYIRVNHDERTVFRMRFESDTDLSTDEAYREWKELVEPGTVIKKLMNCRYVSLGRSELDGVTTEAFQTSDPNCPRIFGWLGGFMPVQAEQINMKIWVDLNTSLPVRSEQQMVTPTGTQFSYVANDFNWNAPLDASDFEPNIPGGYRNPTGNVVMPAFTEDAAIEGLRLFAELAEHYPANPTADAFTNEVRQLIGFESYDGLSQDERNRRNQAVLGPIVGFAAFYKTLVSEEREPAYYGETVKPGDSDRALLRWRLDDGQYRVIFGDLSARTISAEELAELENH